MEKKAEVTAASNDELILELVRIVSRSRHTKALQKTGYWICVELEARKVIDEAAAFYEKWDDMYCY